jgi:hypothetical protein
MNEKYCSTCGKELIIEYSDIICYDQETGRPQRYEVKYCTVRRALPWYMRLTHFDCYDYDTLVEREGE